MSTVAVSLTPVCAVDAIPLEGGVAALVSGEAVAVFRSFDDEGQPIGSWVCLDDSAQGSDFLGEAGIEADGSGYATVARLVNGSVAYRRTDRFGTGDP